MGELWDVFGELFGETWLWDIENTLDFYSLNGYTIYPQIS